MKRHGNLWDKVIDPENIEKAYNLAKKGKGWRKDVQYVENNKEKVLSEIRDSLINKTFTTSEYRMKTVYEPKERIIYILPFIPDRIIQHALLRVVSPIWDKMFDNASNACRPGKGQHTASKKVMEYIRKYDYVLQGDVKKFYPSIDHDIAMRIIERKIKDPDVLWLFRDIIYSFPDGKNVPIGNYSSQWIGNLYMNELDTFVRHELKPKKYVRYNDDFLLFHDDKKILHSYQQNIKEFLQEKLKLTLSKDRVYPVKNGIDFVGYRHFHGYLLLRKSTAKRVKKRIHKLSQLIIKKRIDIESARSSIASTIGWMKWANTYNFKKYLKLMELQEFINAEVQ